MNYEKKCRSCLNDNNSDLFNWNVAIEYKDIKEKTYMDCFREYTKLENDANDGLPQLLCQNCGIQLRDMYMFIERAKNCNDWLQKQVGVQQERASFEWVTVEKGVRHQQHSDQVVHRTISTQGVDTLEPPSSIADPSIDDSILTYKITKRKSIKLPTTLRKRTGESIHKRSCILEQQELLCHACPRTFKDGKTLRQHVQTHEENRQRNYTCEHCARTFFTKTAYHNHVKTHDSNRKAAFQCNQCDKSFFHKGSLKLHMQHHTGQSMECRICRKKYYRSIDLKIHMRSHSGNTPYKCRYCDKAFTQVGILNKHVRHHEGYRYQCDICLKEYLHQSTLIQHRKQHTGLPLKCSMCEKGFVKKSKLKRHLSGVHKIKDFEEMETLILKVKTQREYRRRILNS